MHLLRTYSRDSAAAIYPPIVQLNQYLKEYFTWSLNYTWHCWCKMVLIFCSLVTFQVAPVPTSWIGLLIIGGRVDDFFPLENDEFFDRVFLEVQSKCHFVDEDLIEMQRFFREQDIIFHIRVVSVQISPQLHITWYAAVFATIESSDVYTDGLCSLYT